MVKFPSESQRAILFVAVISMSVVTAGCIESFFRPRNRSDRTQDTLFPVDAPKWSVDGKWWTRNDVAFILSDGEKIWVNSTDKNRVVGGDCKDECEYRVRQDSEYEDGDTQTSYHRVKQETLTWRSEESGNTSETGYPFPLEQGESGSFEDWDYRVVTTDNMTTIAGSYEAVRVDYHQTTNDSEMDMTRWYAPDIGRTVIEDVEGTTDDGGGFEIYKELIRTELG